MINVWDGPVGMKYVEATNAPTIARTDKMVYLFIDMNRFINCNKLKRFITYYAHNFICIYKTIKFIKVIKYLIRKSL